MCCQVFQRDFPVVEQLQFVAGIEQFHQIDGIGCPQHGRPFSRWAAGLSAGVFLRRAQPFHRVFHVHDGSHYVAIAGQVVLPVVVVTFPQDSQPEFHVLQVEEHAQAVAVSFVQAADMPDKVVARLIQLFGVAVPSPCSSNSR